MKPIGKSLIRRVSAVVRRRLFVLLDAILLTCLYLPCIRYTSRFYSHKIKKDIPDGILFESSSRRLYFDVLCLLLPVAVCCSGRRRLSSYMHLISSVFIIEIITIVHLRPHTVSTRV